MSKSCRPLFQLKTLQVNFVANIKYKIMLKHINRLTRKKRKHTLCLAQSYKNKYTEIY